MSVDSTSGTATFYYLSTTAAAATPAGGNGIAYVSPTDLDGDHIIDYVYAGDLKGNVWRFDLTSNDPNNWGVTNPAGASVNAPSPGGGAAAPLFTTQSGQPITCQLLVVTSNLSGNRVCSSNLGRVSARSSRIWRQRRSRAAPSHSTAFGTGI